MTGSAEPAPPTEEPRRPAAAGRLPDFFLVGHSKSGTTALYEMLGRHPQIFLPAMKEPIFFAPELPRRTQRYRAPEVLEEYVALFAGAGPEQVVGEGSASYLRSPNAARLIAQARPDARIVAILREPASFLRSFHLQVVQAHYEDERDLARERERLRAAIDRFAQAGPTGCTQYPHFFFGKLTPEQWAVLMYKHLDHHLRQFGA